jgi:hypothetical protein
LRVVRLPNNFSLAVLIGHNLSILPEIIILIEDWRSVRVIGDSLLDFGIG